MKNVMRIMIILIFSFLSLNQISCDESASDSGLGTVSVLVVDNDANETPIPDVEITLVPINEIKTTDSSGTCDFIVREGSYYVDAGVCCSGPGNIEYHVSVNVVENNTSNVKLYGCSSCD